MHFQPRQRLWSRGGGLGSKSKLKVVNPSYRLQLSTRAVHGERPNQSFDYSNEEAAVWRKDNEQRVVATYTKGPIRVVDGSKQRQGVDSLG